MKNGKMWTNLIQRGSSLKFIVVSGINFLVGFLIFSLTWLALNQSTNYLSIAVIATVLASIWSFQTHNRITLERTSIKNFVSAQYMSFQIVALLLSSMIVPKAATLMHLNLLVVQLLWSFVLSLIGLLILVKFSS
jgi:putative flippase GtrA